MATEIEELPKQFKYAIAILWVALAFSGISFLLSYHFNKQSPKPAELVAVLVVYVVWSFLIFKITRRRDWARLTFLGLTAVGLPFNLLGVINDFLTHPALGLTAGLSVVLPVVGLILLFKHPTKQVFQSSPP